MSAKAVKNAKKRRDELVKELEKIDQFLLLYEEFSTDNTGDSPDKTNRFSNSLSKTDRPSVEKEATKPADIAASARDILLQAGHPLNRGELAKALEEAGLVLGASDKAKYVGTIMWRHRDLYRQIEGQGYWPIDVGYIPSA